AVSTAQVLADIVPEGLMWASDKPMHPQLAKDIVETIAARLRSLTKEGYLLGGSAWLDVSVNQTSELKSGRMVIDYDYTFVPPLEDLGLRQRITDFQLKEQAARLGLEQYTSLLADAQADLEAVARSIEQGGVRAAGLQAEIDR
ncbi:hypothetical protein FJV41_50720, partial [Myxococcus llanfairpwllgwyngyllgogerychwyrndrobwllllantysiliogogogochensis]